LLREGRGAVQRALGFVGRRQALIRALNGVDALVARLPSVIGLQACKIAEELGLPWAVEVVGSAWHGLMTHGDVLARAYAPVAHLQTGVAVRRAGAVLYVTRSFLQREYPTSARSIALSDVDLPEPDAATLARRIARISAAPRPLRIGLIGSVGPRYKGIDTCIDALARIRDHSRDLELLVLGPGDPSRYLQQARSLGVAQSVRFCGALPAGAPVRQWLDSIDIYVQPSRTEGLPRSLLEALSRGCPALGSRVGGIPELLGESCLHPPGDAGALAARLSDLLPPERQLEHARRNYDLALQFAASKLDRQRRAFWAAFMADINEGRVGPAQRAAASLRPRAGASGQRRYPA
jgi:glycosyltransferase involved in cell wall biosynthesis